MAQSGDVVFNVVIVPEDPADTSEFSVSVCTTEEIARDTRTEAMRRYSLPPERVVIEKRTLDTPIWHFPSEAVA